MNKAVGIGQGHDLAAKLSCLFGSEDGYVSGAGNDHGFALEGVVPHGLEHFLGQVAKTIACGLGTHQRAAEGQALAGEHARRVGAPNMTVLAKEEADFPGANTDIAGGHVHELTDMTAQSVIKL